jgi:hypothetical protein
MRRLTLEIKAATQLFSPPTRTQRHPPSRATQGIGEHAPDRYYAKGHVQLGRSHFQTVIWFILQAAYQPGGEMAGALYAWTATTGPTKSM